LLKELDRIAAKGKLSLFAQIGNSGYEPKNFPFERFLDEEEYQRRILEAGILVSHGGAGTIINGLRQGKTVVVVPRLKKFGEHTNDHQLDLAEALAGEGKVIAVENMAGLGQALKRASSFRPRIASNRQKLVKRIAEFIDLA
jgi:UDP-N-acetylglucosamine transferase subunit ALG13